MPPYSSIVNRTISYQELLDLFPQEEHWREEDNTLHQGVVAGILYSSKNSKFGKDHQLARLTTVYFQRSFKTPEEFLQLKKHSDLIWDFNVNTESKIPFEKFTRNQPLFSRCQPVNDQIKGTFKGSAKFGYFLDPEYPRRLGDNWIHYDFGGIHISQHYLGFRCGDHTIKGNDKLVFNKDVRKVDLALQDDEFVKWYLRYLQKLKREDLIGEQEVMLWFSMNIQEFLI